MCLSKKQAYTVLSPPTIVYEKEGMYSLCTCLYSVSGRYSRVYDGCRLGVTRVLLCTQWM